MEVVLLFSLNEHERENLRTQMRGNIVKGYTIAVGAFDLMMFVANASAAGSVMLPSISPLSTA
jgi:hypothetical protein